MDYASKIERQIKDDLIERRQQGERFSLTVDEWTGENNKRYANVNVHTPDGTVHHLGLIRIKGSMTAEACKEMVTQRTAHFGLNIKTDVICCTSDAASVMVKFGKLMECEHQLCYAHGVHLAVCDVLYRKKPNSALLHELEDKVSNDDNSDSDECEEMDNDGLTLNRSDEVDVEVQMGSVSSIIHKVRDVVKVFRKSPVKNDLIKK